jgi:hypothetical protein
MYTIFPADSVTISTFPPGLVTDVTDTNGVLTFKWSAEATTATRGGIKIGMPAGQLTEVKVNAAKTVQVLDGFTSISFVEGNGASKITADLSSNTAALTLKLNGSSTATVKSASNVVGGGLNGASKAVVATPQMSNFLLNGASRLELDGVFDGGSLNGASRLTASGAITGATSLNGASKSNAASCSTAMSLNGASTCNANSPTVAVSTTEQAMILSGSEKCYSWSGGSGWGWGSGASSVTSSHAGITAAAVVGIFLAM